MTIAVRGFRALVLASLLFVPSLVHAQQSKSAALAAELVTLMDERKLSSVAAPQGSEHYVGALYFPGTQLLVVKGRYASEARMNDLLTKKDYREVYLDLSSASEQQSRVFVMDLGANGLRYTREDDQPFDTADVAGKSVTFDGDWRGGKMTEDEYRQVYNATDEQYAQMLQALIDQLRKPS